MTVRLPLAALAVLALAATPGRARAQAQDPEALARDRGVTESEIVGVVQGFHAALAAGDSTAALSFLHPELVVFESGHAETLDEYRSGHLAADMEFARSVEFETTRGDVLVHPWTALWLRSYTAKGSFRGKPVDGAGVETIVLAPTDDGWKILHVHWSSR